MSESSTAKDVAEVVVSQRKGLPIVWIIPLVAVLIGGWLWIEALREQGPEITISFVTAEGLEADKTKVKFKDLEIGTVTSIDFLDDLSGVAVNVEMEPGAEEHLIDSARFWVVRPRIGSAGVSGLGTLISGAYIEMEPGTSGKPTTEYVGLELPPLRSAQAGGLKFKLKADTLGSLSIGTPIYYRRIEVGVIERYRFSEDGNGVELDAFLEDKYAHFLRKSSEFWNASGVSAKLGADGVEIRVESLDSILRGGIAFDLSGGKAHGEPAETGDVFRLFDTREASLEPSSRGERWLLYFEESARGLALGAPVEFRGFKVGTVAEIDIRFDVASHSILIPVLIETHADRLHLEGVDPTLSDRERCAQLVGAGMRAQLETGSLLTGSLFVNLDMFPETPIRLLGAEDDPYPEIPTIPSTSAALHESLKKLPEIVANIDEATSSLAELLSSPETEAALDSLRKTAAETEALVGNVSRDVQPLVDNLNETLDAARKLLTSSEEAVASVSADAPTLQYRIDAALKEFSAGMRSLRTLTDYLERHPEALIKGKGD